MKATYLVISLLISLPMISQNIEIPNIRLTNAKIKSTEKDTTSIVGLMLNTTKYIVKSKTKVATKLTFTGAGNKYKIANTFVAIYHIADSAHIIRDSIYNHIENYWLEQEKWLRACPGYEDSTNLRGDFSVLPINEGFYTIGNDTVPFISSKHGRIGAYMIIYFKNQLFKIVLLESEGAGGLGFIGQNMIFVHENIEYPLVDYTTRWMDEIRFILKTK